MNVDELTRQLIGETKIDDISESYRPVVEIIGVDKFIELSDYAKGDELYFPKIENIIAPARNRRIKKEWNGRMGKSDGACREADQKGITYGLCHYLFGRYGRSDCTRRKRPCVLYTLMVQQAE